MITLLSGKKTLKLQKSIQEEIGEEEIGEEESSEEESG